jgi:hypothetical protein
MTISDTYPNAGSLARTKTTNKRFQPLSLTVDTSDVSPTQNVYTWSLAYSSTDACATGLSHAADNGNIATQTYWDGTVNDYCYDDLNRVGSSSGAISETLSYDPYGNRTDAAVPAADANNRLNSSGFATDAPGNLITLPQSGPYHTIGQTLKYFDTGELQSTTGGGGTTYFYDGHDRRFSAQLGSTTNERHFFYMGESDQVIAERYPGLTGSWSKFVYLGGERVAFYGGGQVRYYFSDHLGSTVMMADINGKIITGWPHKYTAFGVDSGSTPGERRRYTGKERDSESGFDCFHTLHFSIG